MAKKYDDGKLRYDLIPPEVLKALAEIYTYGANKYGDNNWQKLKKFDDRYTAALMRHDNSRRSGEKRDQESGFLHSAHMLCNAAFLCWKDSQEENKS